MIYKYNTEDGTGSRHLYGDVDCQLPYYICVIEGKDIQYIIFAEWGFIVSLYFLIYCAC